MDFRRAFRNSAINLLDGHDHFLLTLFTLGLFFVKCPGGGSRFNHFKYYGNWKSYVNEFFNTSRCQIFNWACRVICLFQQTFACEKVEDNIMKKDKTSPF